MTPAEILLGGLVASHAGLALYGASPLVGAIALVEGAIVAGLVVSRLGCGQALQRFSKTVAGRAVHAATIAPAAPRVIVTAAENRP